MKTRKTDQPSKGDLISTADLNGGAYAVASGTPRTDAEAFDFKQDPVKPFTNMLISSDGTYVTSAFARALERELNEANEILQEREK